MEAVTGLNCFTLIRLLKGSLERKSRGRERGKSCGAEIDDAATLYERTTRAPVTFSSDGTAAP